MFHMNVPKYLWRDAILTSCYLINRMPTRVLHYETPLQTLKHIFPNTRLTSDLPLKIFGCTVFVHVPAHFRSKFDPRAEKCIFLGYAPNKKGYKCFNPTTRKIYVSMDVNFLENIPFYNKTILQGEISNEDQFLQDKEQPKPISVFIPEINKKTDVLTSKKGGNTDLFMPNKIVSQTGGETLQPMSTELRVYTRRRLNSNTEKNPVNLEHGQSSPPSSQNSGNLPMDSTPLPLSNLDIPIAIRKGVRNCTKYPIAKYMSYQRLSKKYRAFTSNVSHLFILRTIQEALGHSKWRSAVQEEMNALQKK